MVGTMIEVPRAALTADEIAEEAEFSPSAQIFNSDGIWFFTGRCR